MPGTLRPGNRVWWQSVRWVVCGGTCTALALWLIAGAIGATAQQAGSLTPGFASKHLIVAGSCPLCPRDPPFYVVRQALAPDGYDVTICELVCAQTNGAEDVARGTTVPGYGPIDFGAVGATDVRWAYDGIVTYADQPPARNLRVVAYVENPVWLVVAVKSSSGIADLHDIAQQQLPVTISGGTVRQFRQLLALLRLSRRGRCSRHDCDLWSGCRVRPGRDRREEPGCDHPVQLPGHERRSLGDVLRTGAGAAPVSPGSE